MPATAKPSPVSSARSNRCARRSSDGPAGAHLQALLPAGAARNAIDCALWDFEAKRTGVPAYRSAGLSAPRAGDHRLHHLRRPARADGRGGASGGAAVPAQGEARRAGAIASGLRAVRAAAPAATLIVDANEAWTPGDLAPMMATCADLGVALIEQPLPAGADARARRHRPSRAGVRR